jgi:hypothetical protein
LPKTVNERPSRCRFYFAVRVFYRELGGRENLNHGVDAMTDTDGAVATAVPRNYDGPDPVELDRLSASLDDLRRYWGEPDTLGDSPGR